MSGKLPEVKKITVRMETIDEWFVQDANRCRREWEELKELLILEDQE